jgi:hypothetical protein
MENKIDLKELNKPVDIEHIDFRIQSISKKGWATILAYKNARYDMNILDEVCGAENWQRDHKELKGNIYAGIGIFFNNKWTWKWDAGAESYSDKEKGEASDSFKRAGFNWGIGRELYDFPFILLELKSNEFTTYKDKSNNERAKQTYDLKLKQWNWNVVRKDDKIIQLTAKDENDVLRYDSTKKVSINKTVAKQLDQPKSTSITIALKEMKDCVSIEQVQACWSKYKKHQTHETFILTKDNLKESLAKSVK